MMRRTSVFILTAALAIAGCSSTPDEEEYVEEPVEQLYNAAADLAKQEKYENAAKKFDEVERQHPYSQWATKAQVMSAHSYYMANDYDDALIAIDRFLQLHPSHKDAAYMFYLRGLSYYEQISDVARDQQMTRLALKTFNDLIRRYPNSKYARDAKLKIDLTHDHLAGKEMDVGRFYLVSKKYMAAINRFNAVVNNYQTTTHVPEALLRLVEGYVSLGIDVEARRTASVLGHNFPGSSWYEDAYFLLEGKRPGGPVEDEPWYKIW